MHSSGMRNVRSSSRLSVHAGIPAPREQTPPDQAPPGAETPRRPVARHAWIPPAMHAGIAHPPGDLLQGMLGYHLQDMLGYHPPVDRHIPVTRMHSSRMCTICSSSHLLGGVPAGGCTCWGCTCWGVYLPEGVPARGCTCQGGVPVPGGGTCQVLPPCEQND